MIFDYQNVLCRMAAASDLGITIKHQDGHRWIIIDESTEYDDVLNLNVRCKCYGGIIEALNMIDEALAATRYVSLMNHYNKVLVANVSDSLHVWT